MTCDHVFEILTRGPFPSGDPGDADLDRHLAACHECREMAEALRPSVALFHESLSADARDLLPGYRGAILEGNPVSLPVAVQAALESQERTAAQTWWRFAVAALVLVAVSLSVRGIVVSSSGNHSQQAMVGAPSGDHQPDEKGRRYLAGLMLGANCLTLTAHAPSAEQSESTGSTTSQHRCCTQCHSAAVSKRPAINTVAILEQSCKACHER